MPKQQTVRSPCEVVSQLGKAPSQPLTFWRRRQLSREPVAWIHGLFALAVAAAAVAGGCRPWAAPYDPYLTSETFSPGVIVPATTGYLPNPIQIPIAHREAAWNRMIDIIDDYFRIEREQRVHVVGDVLTEGRIETYPRVGSTVFEPHRHDSASVYERRLATLQSIRRRATVRVIPEGRNYSIEVEVIQELEEMPSPEGTTAGGATFRYDNSVRRRLEPARDGRTGSQWFPTRRDLALEQEILSRFRACLTPEQSFVAPILLPPTSSGQPTLAQPLPPVGP